MNKNILKEEYKSEVLVQYGQVLGYADLVGEDEVVDIKSVRSYQYKLMKDKKKKYDEDFTVQRLGLALHIK